MSEIMEKKSEGNEEEIRVRLPKGNELFGIVTGLAGAARFVVSCSDGKERLCRVPGSIKREIWVKEGDYVIVKPWEVDDKRGDIIFRYTHIQVDWLKKKGYLKEF
jgi:translation initiation factor 1A